MIASPTFSGRRFTSRFLVIGVFVGIGIAALCGVAILILVMRDDLPKLTEEALAAAEARWDESGPPSYDVDVDLRGARPGLVHVEVRGGRVVSPPTLNGNPIRATHTWETWTVDGQFETIHREFQLAADPQSQMHAAPGTRLILQGTFHPTLGYPLRFRRLALGPVPEVSWEIVRFQAQVQH
jgi:hypothetical protein